MPSVIWAETCRRMFRPRVFVPLGLALVGLIAYIWLESTNRSSGGAGMWVSGVYAPCGTAVLWIIAGVGWFRQGPSPASVIHCGKCGYDLSSHASSDPRCPECGSAGVATTEHRAMVRLFIALPGAVALLTGMGIAVLAAIMAAAIKAGVFDV